METLTNDYESSARLHCPGDNAPSGTIEFESLPADIADRSGPESGSCSAVSGDNSRVVVTVSRTDLLDIDPIDARPDIDGFEIEFNRGTSIPVGHRFANEFRGAGVSSQRAGGRHDNPGGKKQSVEHYNIHSSEGTIHRRPHSTRNQEASGAFHRAEIEPFPAYPSRAASPRVFATVVFGLALCVALLAVTALFSVQMVAAHQRMAGIDRRIAMEVRL
ncbi:hypothetical protein NBH20_01585 [Rhizobium sp. S153]|uniref:Uncharacterized protein n=1 Tax=Ciceribacter sichuanensis TaxID=2949647 RepID=A0ABT0V1Q9_9HYPH|nr:hypothetical protein [Ciceribacter sp. S153]MCM2399834.1 hypothetical protein [Ciceribacter sp. S153]